MNYEELLSKYNILLRENQKLQDEIKALKEQFGITVLASEPSLHAEKSVMTQLRSLIKKWFGTAALIFSVTVTQKKAKCGWKARTLPTS